MNPLMGAGRVGASLLTLGLALSACQGDNKTGAVAAEQAKPLHRFDHMQSVAVSKDTLVTVGSFGVVAVSADAGKSWTRTELAGAPGLIKVSVCGDGRFAALDFDGGLWLGDQKGANWSPAKIPATDALLDLTCTSDNRIWAVGARGAIFLSSDAGKTWDDKSLTEDIQLLNVQFPAVGSGIITGEFGRVLVTSDNGASWKEAGSLGPEFYPQAQDFRDAKNGIVVGLTGAVLETADGGQTWSHIKAPTEAPLYGVYNADADHTVVVGAAGVAFERVSGQWQPVKGLPLADLRGLASTSSQLVLAGTGGVSAVALADLKIAANQGAR